MRLYSELREALIPKAEMEADKFVRRMIKAKRLDSGPAANAVWNKVFHETMELLVKKEGL